MERFAIKIDKKLKANLYKICRLCGIDNPDMVPIISEKPADINENASIDVEAELEMQQKINLLLGLSVTKDDRMPQTMCCLCVDKINDFFEFREMCYATNVQTRKLLGLKNVKKPALDIKPKLEIKEESIVPTPMPAPAPTTAPVVSKNNKKRKAEELAPKEEKPDIAPLQLKKKLRFSTPTESNIKEEVPVQSKKKLRFSVPNEGPSQPASTSSKKSKNIVEDTKLKKEPSPPVPVPAPPPAVSNKKLRLAAPPQKELAIKKSKQKAAKNAEQKAAKNAEQKAAKNVEQKGAKNVEQKAAKNVEQKDAEVKEEIKAEVKEELVAVVPAAKAPPIKALPVPAKVPAPPKLKFGCNICKERFSAKVSLESHRATHIPKVERYVCTACNEILSKSFDIKNHQLWHKLSKTPYVCGCCGESILNTYAFSRHLREHTFDTPPALLVLDRECPLCHTSYATNFLYNIHVCAVKTRRCAGCNRLQRNDAEYLKHSAQCTKVYLNYSKHILPSVEALEDAVAIKNENDVEAAAEEMARISGVSLDMAPVVQLTRLSSPLIMAASVAVSSTGLDDAASTSNKKTGKKGVSKKDLRRVDELLKSTLDALVSIKHEPEVHVDQEAPRSGEHTDNEDHHETDDHVGGLDDFHHNNDTDDENKGTNNNSTNAANTAETLKTVEGDQEQIKIKQEVEETNEENANKIGGGLKLKIKKEHGQLNSSIIEQQKSSEKRAEKRKKKKKHKEKEKDKQKVSKDTQDEHDTNICNNSSEENVATSAIRIKVEPQDVSELGEKSVAAVLQQRPQPEATIMTSIPMMQFQIACVSSGVEFNNATNPTIESQNLSSANHDSESEDVKPNRQELDRMLKISHISSGVAMETGETEENVAEAMDHDGIYDKDEEEHDYNEGSNQNDGQGNENESDHEEDNESENLDEEQEAGENNDDQSTNITEANKKNIVNKKIKKAVSQPKSKLNSRKSKENPVSIAPKSRNKACKSTAKPPSTSTLQISAVQSGIILEPTTPTSSDFIPIFIKPEPQNRGYSDEQTPVTIATPPPQHEEEEEEEEENQEETEALELAHTAEEQNYISTIDFNNITIKQEKDIEISDVQITQKSLKSIAKQNGIKRKRKQIKDNNLERSENLENSDEYMEDEEEQASDEDDEENDSEEMEEEEEEEEADDEEDEEMDQEEENEEREYRELEYPPELVQEKNDIEEDIETNLDISNEENGSIVQVEQEVKAPFVIANVCSQVSTDSSELNLIIKVSEQNITTEQVIADKDTHSLTTSSQQINTTNDLELMQGSKQDGALSETLPLNFDENSEVNISSGAGTNITETNTNAEVLNIVETQMVSESEIKTNDSETENTNAAISQTLQTEMSLPNMPLQLDTPFEIKTDVQAAEASNYGQEPHILDPVTISSEIQNTEEIHSHIEHTAQNPEENLGLLQTEAQSQKLEDQVSEAIQPFLQQSDQIIESNKTANMEQTELHNLPAFVQDSEDQHHLKLHNTVEQFLDLQSTSQALLENIPYTDNSEVQPQSHPTAPEPAFEISSVRTAALNDTTSEVEPLATAPEPVFGISPVMPTAFADTTSEVEPCSQNISKYELSTANLEEGDTTAKEDVIQQSEDANLEAHPVAEHFDNESVNNDKNEGDYIDNKEESEHVEQADEESTVIEGVIQQSENANLEAHPVAEHFDNESVDNDENEGDYMQDIEEENELVDEADEESTLSDSLEERQNHQNQEVLSQIRPTALELHPYLEDISSSSNSLLSNSLSQTPPPQLQMSAASATSFNTNNLNSQRHLNTEETENILNESNEVAETSAMSVSHSVTQPILGQPLPPQMPTFNFDNINEIAENNNNANIEREQLQDEQHQQHYQHN